MIAMVTNDYKVTVIKVQEIEKKWRGNLIKTMGLVKLRVFFPNNFVVYCNNTKLLYNNYSSSDYTTLQLTIYTILQYFCVTIITNETNLTS